LIFCKNLARECAQSDGGAARSRKRLARGTQETREASGADKSGIKAAVGAGSVAGVAVAAAATKAAPKKAAAKKEEAPEADAKPAAPKAAAPKKAAKSDAGDDLTQISGVGPVIVKKLHDLGVTSFAQIAAWSADDVAAMDEKLNFKGRIDRDDWIAQATELAKG